MQADPTKLPLKAHVTKRLKLKRDGPLSNVAFNFNLRRYIRDFTDSAGKRYTALEVASAYFSSGADKISIGSDAVYVAVGLARYISPRHRVKFNSRNEGLPDIARHVIG
jgi:hypothetical protein